MKLLLAKNIELISTFFTKTKICISIQCVTFCLKFVNFSGDQKCYLFKRSASLSLLSVEFTYVVEISRVGQRISPTPLERWDANTWKKPLTAYHQLGDVISNQTAAAAAAAAAVQCHSILTSQLTPHSTAPMDTDTAKSHRQLPISLRASLSNTYSDIHTRSILK